MEGLIGQTLGGYRIISQIGKGGMATVFKAYQPSLDRYVAIKVLPPYYAEQDETFLKRFRQEAKAIASLRHPNILIVLDYGELERTTYLVMEFVEAGTLGAQMGKPMAAAQMARIIGQVAGALNYAHQEGVVHRDIKPSNILLPKPDWPLLTDFGLAKIVGGTQLTQSGTVAGTPAYMSPEQGRGERVDHRSDIYSLGIVLYEMATGVVPFQAETPMAVIVKHIIDPLPLPRSKIPNLSEGIERVILRALAKDPADRFQDVGQLAEALTGAVVSMPPELASAAPALPAHELTTLQATGSGVAAQLPVAARADQGDKPGEPVPTARPKGARSWWFLTTMPTTSANSPSCGKSCTPGRRITRTDMGADLFSAAGRRPAERRAARERLNGEGRTFQWKCAPWCSGKPAGRWSPSAYRCPNRGAIKS